MTKLKEIKPEIAEVITKDAELIRSVQKRNEPFLEVVNPRKEQNKPHPFLRVEIALRGCELSGVFTDSKKKID